jgi:hypothetical protein
MGLLYPCCPEAPIFYLRVEKGTPAVGGKERLGGVVRNIVVSVGGPTVKSYLENFCRFVIVSVGYGGGRGIHGDCLYPVMRFFRMWS